MVARGIQCVDKQPATNGHQLQLWIEPKAGGYFFVIRNAFAPNGKPVKSAVLDSGNITDYETALSDGEAAFAGYKQSA